MDKLEKFLNTEDGHKYYNGAIISVIKNDQEEYIDSGQDKIMELTRLIEIVMEDFNSNFLEPHNINTYDVDEYISKNSTEEENNLEPTHYNDCRMRKLAYIGYRIIFNSQLPVALYINKVLEFVKVYNKQKKDNIEVRYNS